MNYNHQFTDKSVPVLPVGKVVCVGRNYAAHAKELNNPVPTMPLLFMKPATALRPLAEPIYLPAYTNDCQYEIEVAVLIAKQLTNATSSEAAQSIAGYGLALDLTLRDIQQQLKQQGQPWERAKAFDGSCPISPFVKPELIKDPQQLEFNLQVNNVVKQQGNTHDMLWPITVLISHISQYFTLLPGDVVLTGTPTGVGALHPGDNLALSLNKRYRFKTTIQR